MIQDFNAVDGFFFNERAVFWVLLKVKGLSFKRVDSSKDVVVQTDTFHLAV
jgi:hypothetical protein